MKAVLLSVPFRIVIVVLLIAGADFGLIRLTDEWKGTSAIVSHRDDLRYHIDGGPLAESGSREQPPQTTEWVPAAGFKGGARYWAALTLPDPLPRDPVLAVKTNADYVAVYIDGERIYWSGGLGKRTWVEHEELHAVSVGERQGKEVFVRLYSSFGGAELETVYTGSRAQHTAGLFMEGLLRDALPAGLVLLVGFVAAAMWLRRRDEPAFPLAVLMAACLVPQALAQPYGTLRYVLWPDQAALTYASSVLLDALAVIMLAYAGTVLDAGGRKGLKLAIAAFASLAVLHAAAAVYDDALAALTGLLVQSASLVLLCVYGYLLLRQHRRRPSPPSAVLITGLLVFVAAAAKDALTAFGLWDIIPQLQPAAAELLQARHTLWGLLALLAAIVWSEAVRVHAGERRYLEALRKANDILTVTNDAYERFVPGPFLERMGRVDVSAVGSGDHAEARVTVLHAVVRDFGGLTSRLAPEEMLRLLNDYLAELEPLIAYRGGMIDAVAADGFRVLQGGAADAAVDSAVTMQFELRRIGETRRTLGLPAIDIGFGIDTGEVTLGIVGWEGRLKEIAVGAPAGAALKLARLTGTLGAELLISGEAYAALDEPERRSLRAVDTAAVDDGRETVALYEVLDAAEPELAAQKKAVDALFQEGRARMERREYHQAIRVWEACIRTAPDDRAAQVWRDRCRQALRMDLVR